ncbi:MAG: bactofilin family protein [Luteolibacter sp.]
MPDEPVRHRRIRLDCPECGASQLEPAMVVSTQCRACRAHFDVVEGKGVRRIIPQARIAKNQPEAHTAPPPPPKPSIPTRFGPTPPAPRPLILRLIRREKPPREVLCFGCERPFKTIAAAQSSQCPRCGSYLSLADHEITNHSNSRIQTRGNVIIRKSGSITGPTIRCHHLTVLGKLAADVDCSGDLIIRSSGQIHAELRCRQLRVEKNARVEFLHPVTAESAIIHGHVRGQIFCTGSVTLLRKSQLHGLVRAAELITRPGARHTGTLEIIPTPAS